ncbi:MAG: two-component system response regulator OmpR [Methylococcaceae bacterium]|nr:two-component system response regulator OmpR [Methylococcaceae bacterium]
MNTTTKLLVVDDDLRLRDLLERYLTGQGYQVKGVADAKAMDAVLQRERVDLLILDLMLPGEDGLSICRRLRGQGSWLPIVMLTARGDEVDRIVGLEMGADDYLPKPFNPRELLARINAVLRRRAAQPPPGTPSLEAPEISFGPFRLNLATRALRRGNETLSLTSGEFALLKVFAEHPGRPLSREKLLELARGRDLEPYDRSVDVQVSRLRRIIETDSGSPRYIQTVWGHGYVFVPDGDGS